MPAENWNMPPKEGVVFKLTTEKPICAMKMVEDEHYPRRWEHTGTGILRPQSSYFKLIRIGDCVNLEEVKQKLGPDNIPPGQWRNTFAEEFPNADSLGSIGVADDSWVNSIGQKMFPILGPCGNLPTRCFFLLAKNPRPKSWRWLVYASPQEIFTAPPSQ